jgi:hypothetical protein
MQKRLNLYFSQAMKKMGINMNLSKAKAWMASFDQDGDGEIDQGEWRTLVLGLLDEYGIIEKHPSASAKNKTVEKELVASPAGFKSRNPNADAEEGKA